MHTQGITPGGD